MIRQASVSEKYLRCLAVLVSIAAVLNGCGGDTGSTAVNLYLSPSGSSLGGQSPPCRNLSAP